MVKTYLDYIVSKIEAKHADEPEIKDIAKDVISSLAPVFEQNNQLIYQGLLEELVEQNRIVDLISPMTDHPLAGSDLVAGRGLVYFLKEMLADKNIDIDGKTGIVSGSDVRALYVMAKLNELGVKIIACSDEIGVIHDPYGLDLELVAEIKNNRKASLVQYVHTYPDAIYIKNPSVIWSIPCQIAMACNEKTPLRIEDGKKLVEGGCIALAEGTKSSIFGEIICYLMNNSILFMPFKAAVTGSTAIVDPSSITDHQLENVMKDAFKACKTTAAKYGHSDHLTVGANVASFERVAFC